MDSRLCLVATPIGNMEDISMRALKTLKEVDFIAAEDTRHTKKLLNCYQIHKPLISYHEHNKYEKGQSIIKKIKEGKSVALVTDAGTPGISDPGEDLVQLCVENNIPVTSMPGPVAAIQALVLSGLSTRRFVFEGFLPIDKKKRNERIGVLLNETRTIILYEAPHRLKKTLKGLYEHLGNRRLTLARELTKKYEEMIYTTLEGAIHLYDQTQPRGEYVLVIEALSNEELERDRQKQWENVTIEEHVNLYLNKGADKKTAIKTAAKERGVSKREIYNYLVKKK